MVLGADDAVARGVFPQHGQVHELARVLLHVEGTLLPPPPSWAQKSLYSLLKILFFSGELLEC